MSLGENIYRLRTERAMSQSELAEALDVSRQSVSKWETDASVPELDKLLALGEVFGVSLDELIKGEKPEEAKAEEPVGQSQEEKKYCLVLTETIFDKETMTRLLNEEFGYEPEKAKLIVAGAPVAIKRGLRYRDAKAMEQELREVARMKVLYDEDAWNPVKLKEDPGAPPPGTEPAESSKEGGMGFGGTVLAVVLGVVIAVIILSLF